jgi:perosamine synthetase
MDEHNIDCRPFFFPLSSIPAYHNTEQARLARARNRTAYRVTPYGINLPSGLNLTEDNVAFVCAILTAAVEERTKPSTLAVF